MSKPTIETATAEIKALLTEARIDELERMHPHISRNLGNYNEYLDRLAQLKNEATDPVKRVRELRDEWEQRSNK